MNAWRIALACLGMALVAVFLGARPTFGAADLSRYVAMGDSLTAGFAGGGLHIDGQRAAYARLISERARGSRAPFEQPWMTEPGIPAVTRGTGSAPLILAPAAGLGSPINLTLPRPYDNLAVPGAGVADVMRTRSDRGGFHDLILRGIGTQLEQALLLEPSFVSLWAGPSDALGAVVSGVVLDGVTLTPTAEFSARYNAIVQTLVANGAGGGVVATIPRPTTFPFVNAMPPVVVGSGGDPVLVEGARVPLIGPDGPMSVGDWVLLTATPLLARGDGIPVALGGSGEALPDNVVLSSVEAGQVEDRVGEYNEVIRRAAADVGFAVVETGATLDRVIKEVRTPVGERPNSEFPGNGLFSLDGVHFSPLGHAIVANAFIEAINQTYGNAIPHVDVVAIAARERAGAGPGADGTGGFLFTHRAYKNLRFGLGVPKTKRLLHLKGKALKRLEEERRKRLERFRRYELPPPPKLAMLPAGTKRLVPAL